MATGFINFIKHAVCKTAKISAVRYGAHIFNVKIDKDLDNGVVVAIDEIVDGTLDVYKAKAPTGFAGIIDGIASNGNYYVRVTEPGDAVLLHNPELIYEEYGSAFQHASNFYNAAGDIVRGFQLVVGDVFELSAEGFVTNDPALKKTVTVDSSTWKLVPAAD